MKARALELEFGLEKQHQLLLPALKQLYFRIGRWQILFIFLKMITRTAQALISRLFVELSVSITVVLYMEVEI